MGRKPRFYNSFDQYQGPKLNLKHETRVGVVVVVFLLLAILVLLSMFNAAGAFGQVTKQVLRLAFGWMSFGIPLLFLMIALALIRQPKQQGESISTHAYVGAIFLTLSVTGFLHLIRMQTDYPIAFEIAKAGSGGGYLGIITSYPLIRIMGFWASILVMVALIIISLLVTFNISLTSLFRMGRQKIEEEMADGELKISKTASGFVKEPVNGLNKAVKQDKLEPIINRPPEPRRAEFTVTAIRQGSDSSWQFPSVDLLEDSKNRVDSGDIEANAKIIKQTLQEFGIEVEMGMVNVGPTVAQYTFRPVTGIKLSQIGALQNDLALALAASPIRMELPIPGKSLVGIEVPNKTKGIVRIKELLVTHEYQNHASKLAFSLGQDVSGNPLVLDLAKMPHLLIAGATGTGKSVCVNSILISLLYRATPSDVRLIVIDPKRVELSMYNGIPHLLTPVITDHEKAVNALRWAVAEMDRRYKLLSEVHKRNILEYNAAQLEDKMSYIVVMVDELADLMAVAQKDVEATIIRLSQMARAVGIHIVVATQSPRVNVITGLIKANITSRIAFNVASQVDSRTILDLSGAEKLLGSGDMLYVTPELSKPKRAQGTYVIEKEIKRVVEFLKDQSGSVIYNDEVVEKPKRPVNIPGFEGSSEGEEDEVLDQAIELVNSTGKASATFLQRRLSIGYARAARILDVLEQRGVVGPGNGAKPREVFGYTGGTNGIDDSEAEEFERQQVASSAGRDDEEDL